jgi:hypothetical protein
MLTSVQVEDQPEPWLKKKKPVAASRRETRTTTKASAGKIVLEEPIPSSLPSGSGRGRGKGKAKLVEKAKGMKKTRGLPPATVAVVLGRAENPVRSVKELARKTEEDARACGRIIWKVLHPATRKACPTREGDTEVGEDNDHVSPSTASVLPQTSPVTSAVEVSGGITLNHDLISY